MLIVVVYKGPYITITNVSEKGSSGFSQNDNFWEPSRREQNETKFREVLVLTPSKVAILSLPPGGGGACDAAVPQRCAHRISPEFDFTRIYIIYRIYRI